MPRTASPGTDSHGGTRAQVWQITDAGEGLSQEQKRRTRRYLIAMAIRTACVIGAIVTPGPARWVLIVGAVLLPYLAVVAANAGREGSRAGSSSVQPPTRTALTQGTVEDPQQQ